MYPAVELMGMDGGVDGRARSPRRNELLHALREAQCAPMSDTAAWKVAPVAVPSAARAVAVEAKTFGGQQAVTLLPEMVGESEPMLELARLIKLVAPRSTTVLIEGETGTGKEVVAKGVHRLSERANKPFVVLNCAAIPEALLEAELFGHTRGAFTGAVQSRTGRIEAAHGGTLFLDEIGEMPLALQAKMLRFLECGELQRVGDNETMRVDVRVIAATHQPLERRAEEGAFRLDLYHRLAVFPVEVPALRDRMEDLGDLTEHFLTQMGQKMPRKRLSAAALERLREHYWPGNVRELMHVLERAAILAGDSPEIGAEEIRYRRATR
jgi:transcriptional regulator with GAF, ATPase, and Fis domain